MSRPYSVAAKWFLYAPQLVKLFSLSHHLLAVVQRVVDLSSSRCLIDSLVPERSFPCTNRLE